MQKRQPLRALTKQETSVGFQPPLVSYPFAEFRAVGCRTGCIGTLVSSLEAVAKCYKPEARRMTEKNTHNSEAQLSDYLTSAGERVLRFPFLGQLSDLALRWHLDVSHPLALTRVLGLESAWHPAEWLSWYSL